MSLYNMTCGWCMGQGELDLEIVPTEPQTEQEYLQTCTTEQLARELAFIDGYDDVDFDVLVRKWVEWLKKPHTFK